MTKPALHELVISDVYYEKVQARLDNPNEILPDGQTLLHVASQSTQDNIRILQLLLDRGADANATAPSAITPLHLAVACRKRDAVAALIDAGASVNSKDSRGRTPLHLAISKRWPYHPCPLLIRACIMEIVQKLLSHPDIILDPVDEAGETPLMWAVKERNSDAVCALLGVEANPNIPNEENRTPLHEALSAPIVVQTIVSRLLFKNAGIYCEDNYGQTPIDYLVRTVTTDQSLSFALKCVSTIAFQYRIRDSLRHKLGTIPVLSRHLDECYKETRLMNHIVLFDNVTLHDFTIKGCRSLERLDPRVDDICRAVVEYLLSGFFRVYFLVIFDRIPLEGLSGVLLKTLNGWFPLDEVPHCKYKAAAFDAIRILYEENLELKRHLQRVRELLKKTL